MTSETVTYPSDLFFCPQHKANNETESEALTRFKPLVMHLVHQECKGQYVHGACGMDDYCQEAMIALLTAYRTYDPERGPFAAFASTVIRSRLKRVKHAMLSGDDSYTTYLRRGNNYMPRTPLHEDIDQIDLCHPDGFEIDDTRIDVENFLGRTAQPARSVLAMKMAGTPTGIISRRLGIHRNTVANIRRSAARRYNREMERGEATS